MRGSNPKTLQNSWNVAASSSKMLHIARETDRTGDQQKKTEKKQKQNNSGPFHLISQPKLCVASESWVSQPWRARNGHAKATGMWRIIQIIDTWYPHFVALCFLFICSLFVKPEKTRPEHVRMFTYCLKPHVSTQPILEKWWLTAPECPVKHSPRREGTQVQCV